MLIIKLKGGLGNQMFQYALGRSLALSRGKEIAFDLDYYLHFKERVYLLDHFNTVVDIAPEQEAKKLRAYGRKRGRFGFFHNYFVANPEKYIEENPFGSQPDILEVPDGVYLDGWWQSENFFKDIADTIRNEFTLKDTSGKSFEDAAKNISVENSVGLHIRRGDYTTEKVQKGIGLIPLSYYHAAIEKIARGVKDPVFFIFSDDVEWVKANLKIPYTTVFVRGGDIKDYEELILMSLARHHIIANSTFSWWAAWLNKNPEKYVIAPKKWFVDPSKDASAVIPEKWIKI